jgi:hypothetical protein
MIVRKSGEYEVVIECVLAVRDAACRRSSVSPVGIEP